MAGDTPQPPADAREVIARALAPTLYGDAVYTLTNADRRRADAALAALRALPLASRLAAIGVDPATHVLVPRVATKAMLCAPGIDGLRYFDEIYAAMLAAAEAATDGR